MQRLLYLFAFLIFSNNLFSQAEEVQIRETLMNYIDGTSYNRIDQINKAFYPDANLYLDNKEKKLWVVPISEYAGFFKNKKAGVFNGRIGKIMSIDYFGNIAQAKAEILIPASRLRYVDLFILKKIEGEWKIISKTATGKTSNKTGDRILFIVSNAHFYGDSKIKTGNSFSEIVNAFDTFDEAGYTLDFVSPEGGAIPIGYMNTSDPLEKEYLYNNDFMYALKNTKSPQEINPKDYKAVYYVGGGSAMFGVPENEEIHKIVMNIYEEQKGIISSVCHGTAGIVNLKTKDGKYLVDGKNVNGYPDDYENKTRDYYKEFPFPIQQTIEARGGNFKYSERNNAHVEVDGQLITGQNFLSSRGVALKIIEQLEKNK